MTILCASYDHPMRIPLFVPFHPRSLSCLPPALLQSYSSPAPLPLRSLETEGERRANGARAERERSKSGGRTERERSNSFSETQVFAAIELEEGMLVEVLVAGLHEVGLSTHIVVLRLVELSDSSLAILVLGLHQLESVLRAVNSLSGATLLALRIDCIEIDLLDFLVECLLRIVELQLLRLLRNLGITDVVARLETVEDGHAQAQADILREVVLQLRTETGGRHAGGGIVVGAQSTIQRQRGIVASTCYLDGALGALQTELLRENLWLDAQGLGIDNIGRRE